MTPPQLGRLDVAGGLNLLSCACGVSQSREDGNKVPGIYVFFVSFVEVLVMFLLSSFFG